MNTEGYRCKSAWLTGNSYKPLLVVLKRKRHRYEVSVFRAVPHPDFRYPEEDRLFPL